MLRFLFLLGIAFAGAVIYVIHPALIFVAAAVSAMLLRPGELSALVSGAGKDCAAAVTGLSAILGIAARSIAGHSVDLMVPGHQVAAESPQNLAAAAVRRMSLVLLLASCTLIAVPADLIMLSYAMAAVTHDAVPEVFGRFKLVTVIAASVLSSTTFWLAVVLERTGVTHAGLFPKTRKASRSWIFTAICAMALISTLVVTLGGAWVREVAATTSDPAVQAAELANGPAQVILYASAVMTWATTAAAFAVLGWLLEILVGVTGLVLAVAVAAGAGVLRACGWMVEQIATAISMLLKLLVARETRHALLPEATDGTGGQATFNSSNNGLSTGDHPGPSDRLRYRA